MLNELETQTKWDSYNIIHKIGAISGNDFEFKNRLSREMIVQTPSLECSVENIIITLLHHIDEKFHYNIFQAEFSESLIEIIRDINKEINLEKSFHELVIEISEKIELKFNCKINLFILEKSNFKLKSIKTVEKSIPIIISIDDHGFQTFTKIEHLYNNRENYFVELYQCLDKNLLFYANEIVKHRKEIDLPTFLKENIDKIVSAHTLKELILIVSNNNCQKNNLINEFIKHDKKINKAWLSNYFFNIKKSYIETMREIVTEIKINELNKQNKLIQNTKDEIKNNEESIEEVIKDINQSNKIRAYSIMKKCIIDLLSNYTTLSDDQFIENILSSDDKLLMDTIIEKISSAFPNIMEHYGLNDENDWFGYFKDSCFEKTRLLINSLVKPAKFDRNQNDEKVLEIKGHNLLISKIFFRILPLSLHIFLLLS